jgi:polyketide synthase PksN
VTLPGVLSPDGKSKAFDAQADGTGCGEGCGMVLLKLFQKASADRDNIHALIKASATNQDGGRSNGVTAPSPTAQTELILDAWNKSGIDPATIMYVEAHGTGTKLGDPIEIQALAAAFKKFTESRHFCAVGSIKTNIGHLDGAAGIAGLIKVVLSLKHKKLFPSLHFVTPNSFIDFENTALYVSTAYHDWPATAVRRAAVSSFGISGTNAHVVLEAGPALPATTPEDEHCSAGFLITISAKSENALRHYLNDMRTFVKSTNVPLADVCYVMNRGRDDYRYRYAAVVHNRQELEESLSRALASELKASTFLLSGMPEIDVWRSWMRLCRMLVLRLSSFSMLSLAYGNRSA